MKKIKNENQILIMLALFSISVGLWGNFRQLWLQDNNFSVTNISNILSIGTLISVIIIGLIGKYIKLDKLKNTLVIVLLIKFVNMFWLYFLNQTNSVEPIELSITIDIVTEYIIITSIYPLITTIIKTGTIYSKRRLTEYLFRDVGILFGGMFIGKNIAGILINYNACLFISNIFLMFSLLILLNIKGKNFENDNEEISSYKYNIWTNEIKKINDHLINKGYNVICSSIDNEKNLKDILSTINLTFNLFLIISFVITFFLMGIIIYSLIMERKREIALMKINGLNNKDVKSIISFDAIIISLISFISVVIIFNFVLNILNKYLKLYLKIDNFLTLPKKIIFSYDIYLYLLLFCLLIGLLFSFIPLRIYLSKKECDLMREE